jgi:hypothetical protein
MSRSSLKMSALGMALALPALVGARSDQPQQQAANQHCGWEDPQSGSDDSRWQWRLRAYRHLDCVTAIVDQALGANPARTGGKDTVEISRQELERIRTLAWWARDAAARIGQ